MGNTGDHQGVKSIVLFVFGNVAGRHVLLCK